MDDLNNRFLSDLQREDDVGLVLLGHLHIEHQLIELISCVLPFPERCGWGKLSYSNKVSLAHACGLSERLKSTLGRIGKLRNDFAHNLGASLAKDNVLALYNGLPTLYQNGVKDTYRVMGLGELTSPAKLPPRDLLILI